MASLCARPQSGGNGTGELIRAVEKVRDEAQRNGNVNWRDDHAILIGYVRDTLLESGSFDVAAVQQIARDTQRLLDFEHPETRIGHTTA